ncbi:F-box only protein 21-like isoform X2 [Eriocheir sinensis]|uniref:F-box only protein 21-like isoform X2 n=1 Tax=Eriocheir sinensis TaxID=95602 RepID=UPI0021CA3403|nr:F-box only protein 21-like isoform X2 [Eriocheir sinensis]
MAAEEDGVSLTLLDLPDELLLSILCCNGLLVRDVCRVACTCSRLRDITDTQRLWRHKLQQICPEIWDLLSSHQGITDWQEEVKQIFCFGREMRKLVSGLSRKLYQNPHLTTAVYNEVDVMFISTPFAAYYMKYALTKIIEDGAQYTNLTEKYYALRVISHVHQGVCRREWQEFLAQPSDQQSLEVGSMLLARWFQPHTNVTIKQMVAEIDQIAEMCRSKLRTAVPDHPAVLAPLVPSSEKLPNSKWNRERCQQLFMCINDVLYNQLKFEGNSHDYYNLNNSLLNEVLSSRTGIPITLSILYLAVCHRFGILLEPVNFPTHFLVRWNVPGTTDYKYIDAFDKGRLFSPTESLSGVPLLASHGDMSQFSCGALQVFQRMIRNIMNVAQMQANLSNHMELYCPATELLGLLLPDDHGIQELLFRIYYTLEIHYDRIIVGCQNLLEHNPSTILEEMLTDCKQMLKSEIDIPKPITPNPRKAGIAFATGLIMRHKAYHYSCVIFGWDEECKMPVDWVRRMGVDSLQHKGKQPFYNVLVQDGSHRYAAQEHLLVNEEPVPIGHPDVGKYFKEFTGTHYIPNDELEQQYPGDGRVRNNILRERGFL